MYPPPQLALGDLLDVCQQNRLIDRYEWRGADVTISQAEYVHELTPDQARLFLESLVRLTRTSLIFPAPRLPALAGRAFRPSS